MTLSIIIPVFNVATYLRACLESVLRCDLSDCEILLSMGRSSDESEEICRDFDEKNQSIRAFYQEGQGLSDARNFALSQASGRYILFVDGDDLVDWRPLSKLICRLRDGSLNPDLIVADFYFLHYPSGWAEPRFQIGAETPEQFSMDFFPEMLHKRQCFWNVWRYIYRKGFLEENHILFKENQLSEDVDFTTSVFLAGPDIVFSHSPYYYYCVDRGSSLMDRPTLRRLEDTVQTLTECIVKLRLSDFLYAPEMMAQFQFEFILNMAIAVELKREDRPAALALFQNWRDVLKDSRDVLTRGMSFVIRILGLKTVAQILHGIKLIKCRVKDRKGRKTI